MSSSLLLSAITTRATAVAR